MKGNFRRNICFFITLFFVISLIISQTIGYIKPKHPGFHCLTDVSVNSLRVSTRPGIGVGSVSFVGSVGGIAFGNTSKPATSLNIDNISLIYNPNAVNGERLRVLINGEKYIVPIYDWKLKPILLYSGTEYYSCFSLFGTTGDEGNDKFYKKKYNIRYLASYHPDFKNTLVGLRLLQMDSFLTDLNNFDDLPTYTSGNIIFGGGENSIDRPSSTQSQKRKLVSLIDQYEKFQAYVITDYPVDIRFFISGGKLKLTGDIYVHFWKRKSDTEIKAIYDKILEKMIHKYNLQKREDGSIYGTPVNISNAQKEIKDLMDQSIIVSLKRLSDKLYQNIHLIESINPVVYECARDVMRYSAFFRYCKTENPINFEEIRKAVSNIDITPNVETPNGIE